MHLISLIALQECDSMDHHNLNMDNVCREYDRLLVKF